MQQIGRLNSLPLTLGLSLDTFWSWSGVGLGHPCEGDFKNQTNKLVLVQHHYYHLPFFKCNQ